MRAEPLSLYRTIPFVAGTIACLMLLSVIGLPIRSKNFWIRASAFSSSVRSTPKYSAAVSFVRSSSVGPRPPVVMMRSALENAW